MAKSMMARKMLKPRLRKARKAENPKRGKMMIANIFIVQSCVLCPVKNGSSVTVARNGLILLVLMCILMILHLHVNYVAKLLLNYVFQ